MKRSGITGAERIAAERKRQIISKNWLPEHDDEHTDGELGLAAACYATPAQLYMAEQSGEEIIFKDPWPWNDGDKRERTDSGNVLQPNSEAPIKKRIRQLEKAGALCAAEIDRLLRIIKEEEK